MPPGGAAPPTMKISGGAAPLTKRVPGGAAPLTKGVSGGAAPLTKRVPGGAAPLTLPYYPRERVQHSPPAPPSPGRGCTIPGTSSIEVAAPPGIPSVRGCRTPGTHFGTLRGVRLCKTTDVLEFSSTLMEQRTLDARRVLLIKTKLILTSSISRLLNTFITSSLRAIAKGFQWPHIALI